MDRKNYTDLIEVIQALNPDSRENIDLFARTFFETITEGLAEDKFVKIKGIGTFKTIEVSSRDSVDVNTGNRIKIGKHAKITFTPDAYFRDMINKPFAHLQSVIINEGTDVNLLSKTDVERPDVPRTENIENEEEETAKAIESGAGADAFEKLLDSDEEEFDPLELLMGLGDEKEVKVEYSDEETLFSDLDYVKNALDIFTDTEEIKYSDLTGTQGVEIKLTDNVKKRIRKLMPPEAMPSDDYLRLSPDREYCLQDMKRCMQNDLAETAWPATQFLWKLHPIFNWIEDKAGVFYKRSEVPVLGLSNELDANGMIFIVEGLIPNRKSTTVVDEWFGVSYRNGQFENAMTMSEVMQKTHLNTKAPNTQQVSAEQIAKGQSLLNDVVERAKKIMSDKCAEYKAKTDPYIYEEMERLEALERRHKDAQLSLFDLGIAGMERKKSEKEREIEAIFSNFMDWEKDTLEIEENPYIRIIAVVTGVR